ncbi:DNA topoisomerase large subunit [Klebsiella phage CPRSA]|nr:DNA topoisomerase large subunit [Klebsiella phage CPRSA]
MFLTEGDSAVGQFIECRNEETQGAFPLRGKPLNTWGMSFTDIIKNKELFELMAILNIHPGDTSGMTYDNIGIMVDADVDGGDILTLLLAFFSRWPSLFAEKRIRYIRTQSLSLKLGARKNGSILLMSLHRSAIKQKMYDISRGWVLYAKKITTVFWVIS